MSSVENKAADGAEDDTKFPLVVEHSKLKVTLRPWRQGKLRRCALVAWSHLALAAQETKRA